MSPVRNLRSANHRLLKAREEIISTTDLISPPRSFILLGKPRPHLRSPKGVYEDMEELLTVPEVARRLRVDTTTVRRWIKSGALQAVTLPHRGQRQVYRVKKSTVDSLLTPHLVTQTGT